MDKYEQNLAIRKEYAELEARHARAQWENALAAARAVIAEEETPPAPDPREVSCPDGPVADSSDGYRIMPGDEDDPRDALLSQAREALGWTRDRVRVTSDEKMKAELDAAIAAIDKFKEATHGKA